MDTFGKRLKELRKSKGITQQQLADILSVDRTSVGKWETDKNLANNDILNALCAFFSCTMDYLLGRTNVKALNLNDQEPIIDNPLLSELNKRGISLEDLRNLSPADIELLARMAESLVAKK